MGNPFKSVTSAVKGVADKIFPNELDEVLDKFPKEIPNEVINFGVNPAVSIAKDPELHALATAILAPAAASGVNLGQVLGSAGIPGFQAASPGIADIAASTVAPTGPLGTSVDGGTFGAPGYDPIGSALASGTTPGSLAPPTTALTTPPPVDKVVDKATEKTLSKGLLDALSSETGLAAALITGGQLGSGLLGAKAQDKQARRQEELVREQREADERQRAFENQIVQQRLQMEQALQKLQAAQQAQALASQNTSNIISANNSAISAGNQGSAGQSRALQNLAQVLTGALR